MWKQVTSNSTTAAKNFRRIARSNDIDHVITLNSTQTMIESVPPRIGNNKRKKWTKDTEDLINRICSESYSHVSNKKPESIKPEDYEEAPCGVEVITKIAAKHKGSCYDCGHLLASHSSFQYHSGKKKDSEATRINDQNAIAEVTVRSESPVEMLTKDMKEIYMERGEQYIRTVQSNEEVPAGYGKSDLSNEIRALEEKMVAFYEDMANRTMAVSEFLAPIKEWASSITEAEKKLAEIERQQAEIDAKKAAIMKELGI